MTALVTQYTAEIKALVGRTAQNMILIGEKLQAVKAQLPHGEWLAWLKREFAWGERTARNMMQVAERFKSAQFADLPIETSALYLLAAPHTPEPVVAEALRLAEQGETISHMRVKALLTRYHPPRTGASPGAGDGEAPMVPGTAEAPQAPAATPARDASQSETDTTALGDLDVRAPVQVMSALDAHVSPSPGAPVTQAGDPAPAGPAQVQWIPRVAALIPGWQKMATVDDCQGSVDDRGCPPLPALSECLAYVAADQLDALQAALDQVMHTLSLVRRLIQERRLQATPGSPPAPARESSVALPLPPDASSEVIRAAIVAVLPSLPRLFTSDEVVHRTGGRYTAVGRVLQTMVKSGELRYDTEEGRFAVVGPVGDAVHKTARPCGGEQGEDDDSEAHQDETIPAR